MTLDELFARRPLRWGLRGDPFVWDAMRERFRGSALPADMWELRKLLEQAFAQIVGVRLGEGDDPDAVVFREEFGIGSGISDGHVSLRFWSETAIPILLDRWAAVSEGGFDSPTGELPVARCDGTLSVGSASKRDVESVGVAASAIDHERALADRQALIQLCLYAMDRARSGGVAERIEQGLAGVGVHALRPDGQRFDPAVHEAGGAVPTQDKTLEGTVAETEVVGFLDGDRLLRAPVVTVYTCR